MILLATLAGAETFTVIARYAEETLKLLRRFRLIKKGTPSHDHLTKIFATLDPKAFHRWFLLYVAMKKRWATQACTPARPMEAHAACSRQTGRCVW